MISCRNVSVSFNGKEVLSDVSFDVGLYEVRESDLRDIGVDYLAWKNGPGLDLAAFGYSDGRVHNTDTAIFQALDALGDGVLDAWGHGGYLASAVFNLDLVRLLRQNGTAKLSARTELAVLNTPIYGDAKKDATSARSYTVSLVPGYINFAKDGNDATLGSESGESELKIKVNNPVVCFAVKPEELGKWSAKATDKATIEGDAGASRQDAGEARGAEGEVQSAGRPEVGRFEEALHRLSSGHGLDGREAHRA